MAFDFLCAAFLVYVYVGPRQVTRRARGGSAIPISTYSLQYCVNVLSAQGNTRISLVSRLMDTGLRYLVLVLLTGGRSPVFVPVRSGSKATNVRVNKGRN